MHKGIYLVSSKTTALHSNFRAKTQNQGQLTLELLLTRACIKKSDVRRPLFIWLSNMTLSQGHNICIDHGQSMCEISRTDTLVRIYGHLRTSAMYTLLFWPLVKVLTHSLIMDDNYVKYPDTTSG